MLLTWHIVRKDLLHLRPWFALLVGAILLRYANAFYFSALDPAASEVSNRWDLPEITDWVLLAIALFSTAITAATLVHSDPVTGTKAFWPTRPISAPRLLLAKIITLLILVLLPLILQLAWWKFHDYSAVEIAAQLPAMLARHGITAFASFFFALLTRNAGHFLLSALLCTLAFGAMMVALAQFSSRTWIVQRHNSTWVALMASIVIAGVVAAILTQYLTRRTRLTIGIIVSIFLLCFAASAFWRWPFIKRTSYFASFPRLSPDPGITVQCEDITAEAPPIRAHNRIGKSTALIGRLNIHNIPEGSYVDFFEPSVSDSSLTAAFRFSRFSIESAFKSTHTIETFTITRPDASLPTIEAGQTITVPMLLRHVHVVARLPLKANARARHGAFSTKILHSTASVLRTEPTDSSSRDSTPLLTVTIVETCPSHLIDPVSGHVEDNSWINRPFIYNPHEGYFLVRDNQVVRSLSRSKGGHYGNIVSIDGVQYDRLTLRFTNVAITEADLDRYELVRVVAPAAGTFERTVTLPATTSISP